MSNQTENEVLRDLVVAGQPAQTVTQPEPGESSPYALVPADHIVVDLEDKLPMPTRKRGSITLRDHASFISVVNDQKGEDTRLYGVLNPKPKFTAVFNDNGKEPGWRDHCAVYECPLSIEWNTWQGFNKKQMGQEAFAQFIEDNAPDCLEPAAAHMIEVSRTLEAKKKVNFASAIRLDNGQQEFTYNEEVSGTASKGKLQIPQVFTIAIPVLEGGPNYKLAARLRYRISDAGVLTLWYDIERSHKVLEHAIKEVAKTIADGTGLTLLNGG